VAEPITAVRKHLPTEQELQQESLNLVISNLAKHGDALHEMIKLLQELHESGVLETINALLATKDQVAKIAVGQLLKPNITKTMNNLMGAAEVLGELDPEMMKKLFHSVALGMERAGEQLDTDKKVGVLDLLKVSRDPDINRAVAFGLSFLKGVGEGLKPFVES